MDSHPQFTSRRVAAAVLACALALALPAPGAAAPEFAPPLQHFPVYGNGPGVAIVGDFNADGIPDFATDAAWQNYLVTSTTSAVSVVLGAGGGSVEYPDEYRIGSKAQRPSAIASADFNRDGRPDLAVASGPDVAVLLAAGEPGKFAAPAKRFAAGKKLNTIATADFDVDGNPDVVATNEDAGDEDVLVLLGDGTGKLGSAKTAAARKGPSSVAVGKLNGDSFPDLAVTNSESDSVSVLRGQGNGRFKPAENFHTGWNPRHVLIAKVDGGSHRDLLVTNFSSDYVSLLKGNGSGGFADQVKLPVTSVEPFRGQAAAYAKVDADSKPDLVVGGGRELAFLRGKGNGRFAAAESLPVERYPAHWPHSVSGQAYRNVTIADLDRDGRKDVFAANRNLMLLLAARDPLPPDHFQEPRISTLDPWPRFLAGGEFDGDPAPDLVFLHWNPDGVALLRGNGLGGFAQSPSHDAGFRPRAPAVGDVNGDGRDDLAVVNGKGPFSSENEVTVLVAEERRGLTRAGAYGVAGNPSAALLADLDGGGRDLVVAAVRPDLPGFVSIRRGDGRGGFGAVAEIPVGRGVNDVAAGDFTGDRIPDLVTSDEWGPTVTILPGRGDLSFGDPIVLDADTAPAAVAAADLDHDGIDDVVAQSHAGPGALPNGPYDDSPHARVWLGGPQIGPPRTFALGTGRGVALADVDADGNVDLLGGALARAYSPSPRLGMPVLLGDGAGGFGSRTVVPVGRGVERPVVADFDGSGLVDLAFMTGSVKDNLSIVLARNDVPQPVLYQKVVVTPKVKPVRVRCDLEGERVAIEIDRPHLLNMGCLINAPEGKFTITWALDAHGTTQSAEFEQGALRVSQEPMAETVDGQQVELPMLTLKTIAARACGTSHPVEGRQLWSEGFGRFRTLSRYGTVTPLQEGSRWLIREMCEGTRLEVKAGKVRARNLAGRTRDLGAGQAGWLRP